jgi:hypothetical protein
MREGHKLNNDYGAQLIGQPFLQGEGLKGNLMIALHAIHVNRLTLSR